MLSQTSRASNPAWYQDGLDLELQLHIRVDGNSVNTFFCRHSKQEWKNGPPISESDLRDASKMQSLAAELLKIARAERATSLGVIFHIADEFATAVLKPDFDNPAALQDLRDAAYEKPESILEDSSVSPDQNSWRVLPYPALGSGVIGTTVTVSRQYAPFLTCLRQFGESQNFPIITHALSAPLVALMGMAQNIQLNQGKSFISVMEYRWFTALFFFNQHADLLLMRTLQHRHLRRSSNLRNAISTTTASLELTDPDIHIFSLGPDVDPGLLDELSQSFPSSMVAAGKYGASGVLPDWSPEPIISSAPPAKGESATSLTFGMLRDEKWALQDFLPAQQEVREIYPSRSEMRLLRTLVLARVGLLLMVVTVLTWLAFGVFDVIRREEWAFQPNQTNTIKTRLATLTAERQKTEHWDNLLEDRSKAWASMELLSRLFPERSGVLVKSYAHTVRTETTPGQAKIGFIKEWKIIGFARDEAIDRLNSINTQEGISAHFTEVSKITGNQAFDPALGNRSIAVNVRTQENNRFKPVPLDEMIDSDENTYSFSFDLSITQRFEATDPLAINVVKVTKR
jgi:hypothetical protein